MVQWKTFGFVGVFVFGIALGWILDDIGGKAANIGWKFGESELTIDLKKDLSSPDVLLDKIFSEEFSRLGTTELLKLKYNIFPFCDPELVKKISTLSIDHPVSIELQKLADKRVGPFGYQVDTVLIGVPSSEDQPKQGFANVCETGKYRGRKIQICHRQTDKKIQVTGSGMYICPPELKYPDIQLNIADAKRLFGDIPLRKYEKAIVVILD